MFTSLARIEEKLVEQDQRFDRIESLLLRQLQDGPNPKEGLTKKEVPYEMPTSPEELDAKLKMGDELVSNQLS